MHRLPINHDPQVFYHPLLTCCICAREPYLIRNGRLCCLKYLRLSARFPFHPAIWRRVHRVISPSPPISIITMCVFQLRNPHDMAPLHRSSYHVQPPKS